MNENFDKIYEELSTQVKQFNIEKLPITKQISENIKDEISKIDIKSYIIYSIPILCLFGLISLFKNSDIDGKKEEIDTEKKYNIYLYIFVCVIIFIGIYYFIQNLYIKKVNRPIFFM
jgi:hypothetical protein